MREPESRTFRLVVVTAFVASAFLASAPAATKAQVDPPIQKFDARTFNVVLAVLPGWKAKIVKDPPGAVFQYVDEPARSNLATIGIFRFVVPPKARDSDRAQLGWAYVIEDISGTQRAFFKLRAGFTLVSNVRDAIGGGQLLTYMEDVDATDRRLRTTKFVRAWVFFPKSYAQDGGLYLVLGYETFRDLQTKPVQLERATEIVAGLHEP